MSLVSAAVLLFFVMDPLGNVPLFLSVLKAVPPQRRRLVLVREILIAYAVLIVFLLLGRWLLRFLGLEPEAVSIAGGIVLFLIALRMIFPGQGSPSGDALDGEPSSSRWRFRWWPARRRLPPWCCSRALRGRPSSRSCWPSRSPGGSAPSSCSRPRRSIASSANAGSSRWSG